MVEHGSHQVTVTTNGTERCRPVDVPRDFVKHRFEHVHCDEPDPALDQPASQQATLAELVVPILLSRQLFERDSISEYDGRQYPRKA